jgi:Flp pilus assembly protein TadG
MAGSFPDSGEKLEKTCRSYRKKRRGAAAVEFAVVSPLLLLLILGLLEFGRMVMVQQVITNASREGARHAITRRATSGSVTEICQHALKHAAVKHATVSVNPDPATAPPGTLITVRTSADYLANSWLPGSGFFRGTRLSNEVAMRKE